jgi:uncharacterized membrane protein
MKFRAAGFNKVRVGELFNLFEGTVEHKVNAIIFCVYNVDETAFETFKKPGKVAMQKCNIANVVNLKCGERNHYNSSCLMATIYVLW